MQADVAVLCDIVHTLPVVFFAVWGAWQSDHLQGSYFLDSNFKGNGHQANFYQRTFV